MKKTIKTYFLEQSGSTPLQILVPQDSIIREISLTCNLSHSATAFCGAYIVKNQVSAEINRGDRTYAALQLELQGAGQIFGAVLTHPNQKILANESLYLVPSTSAGSIRTDATVILEFQG